MRIFQRMVGAMGVALTCLAVGASVVRGQDRPQSAGVRIPEDAAVLEGTPAVKIEAAEGGSTRRVLSAEEAAKERLTVRVVDGRFYWTSRENRLLQLSTAGEFTYLSSDPGHYIKIRKLNDRISYVEHMELDSSNVTWFGELKIVGRK